MRLGRCLLAGLFLVAFCQTAIGYGFQTRSEIPDAKIQALSREAEEARQSRDFERAEALSRQIVELRPKAAIGYFSLARVYERKQDFPSAASALLTATQLEPTNFQAQYQLGMVYLRAGEAKKAIPSLAQAERLQPNDKLACRALALAFIGADEIASAVEQFRKCEALDPRDIQVIYDLGQAYLRLAITISDKILRTDSTSPYARRIFAENYLGKNDLSQAEAQYRLALASEPNTPDLRVALGEIRLKEGKVDEARAEFQRAAEFAPVSLSALYGLGEVALLQGDLPTALSKLNQVAARSPEFLDAQRDFSEFRMTESVRAQICAGLSELPPSEQRKPAVSFLRDVCQGTSKRRDILKLPSQPSGSGLSTPVTLRERKKLPLASDELCLQEVGRTGDSRARGELVGGQIMIGREPRLGNCAFDRRDYESAYRHFSAAVTSDPGNLELLYWQQASARRLAQAAFERVREIDPDSHLIHLVNARVQEEQQRPDLAAQEYKAAIARQPGAANVRVLLANLYWKWEKYEEALPELLEALRLDSADPAANFLIGDIWVQQHEAEKALPYLRKALELRPSFLNARASMGRALGQLGRYEEAVLELANAAPSDADGSIHYQLYQFYRKLGKEKEAQEALAVAERIRSQHRPRVAPASPEIP